MVHPAAGGGAAPNNIWGYIPPWLQNAAAASDSAGRAYLFMVFPQPTGAVTVSKVHLGIGTASGNIDAGIYSLSGTTMTRVASAGGVACPAAGGDIDVNMTASATLQPGTVYYLAVAADNTTATFFSAGVSGNLQQTALLGNLSYRVGSGIGSQPSCYPLPATINLALGSAGAYPPLAACLAAR
jgi:hypothetical protein